jgi:hypothetical protein
MREREKHRATRHPFVAVAQVTDLRAEKQISGHTEDLSAYGCFVETITPFAADTKVRLRITRSGEHMIALGKVAYSRPGGGMGIVFVSFEPGSLAILDRWLDSLRK